MKKVLPALWALVGALLLLGAVFFLKNHREREVLRARFAFDTGAMASVTRITIRSPGDRVTLIREGGPGDERWITESDRFPADTARLRRVLRNLLSLQIRERVSSDSDGSPLLAQYGLDSSKARWVEWTLGGAGANDQNGPARTVRVILGKTSGIDFGSSFWKYDGVPGVYRTPGTFVYEVSYRPKDWKDTNLFVPFGERDIRSVAVEWTGNDDRVHRFDLARDTGGGGGNAPGFVLTEPFRAPAGRMAAAAIFRHAAQFKIDEFVSGADTSAKSAALDAPVMTLRITLRDGRENVVAVGAKVDGLYRYVRHPRHPDPVRVFQWRFEYFRKTAEDFVDSAGIKPGI